MPSLEVPGATLRYDVAGDPAHPAVLFVHAGVATRAMWDPQFEDLAADHHVIRYDCRGYGESRGADEPGNTMSRVLTVPLALPVLTQSS